MDFGSDYNMSVIFRIQGGDELVQRLNAFPAEFQAALINKMENAASEISQYLKGDLLSGGLLEARSGRLRASTYARVYASLSRVTLSVGSRGDVPYAGIQEYGGTTGPHDITPSKANVLAFMQGGKLRFARLVQHPGSNISAKAYLRTALTDKASLILDAFSGALQEVANAR